MNIRGLIRKIEILTGKVIFSRNGLFVCESKLGIIRETNYDNKLKIADSYSKYKALICSLNSTLLHQRYIEDYLDHQKSSIPRLV